MYMNLRNELITARAQRIRRARKVKRVLSVTGSIVMHTVVIVTLALVLIVSGI